MAHDEPPHQDLRCLQIQLFSSLVVKVLNLIKYSFVDKLWINGLHNYIHEIAVNSEKLKQTTGRVSSFIGITTDLKEIV